MHVNDPATPDTNDDADDFTAAERAELDADTAAGGAPTGEQPAAAAPAAAAPAAADAPAAGAAADTAAQDDATARAFQQLAEHQAATSQALAEVTKRLNPDPAPAAEPTPEAPPQEPNWDAEKAALKQKFDDGDIDDDQYERERENLVERRAEWRADARVREGFARMEQEQQQRAAQTLEKQWNDSLASFMADEGNASFLGDHTRAAAFNAVLATVAQEKPDVGYPAMLAAAMNRTRTAFGMAVPNPQADKDKIAEAVKNRQQTQTPPDLSRAPQAGAADMGEDKFAHLDGLDADALENALARMPESEIEDFLASAPGGLLDNPRGTGRD